MRDGLLQRFWFGCRHRFSWPRQSEDGEYYQVCLECGVKYRYDWNRMRRTARVRGTETAVAVTCKSQRRRGRTNAWQTRERRLQTSVPVQFRPKGSSESWRVGRSENISRSGLLFTVEGDLPAVGSELELVFLLPAEICGTAAATVLCHARVARIKESTRKELARVAAAISDCVYIDSQTDTP